ncbi:uncharacterized protein LOC130636831 [Hydractinia symbiolongicarpus]|uniref:uncharacterized protein LOC130636831 n=1 Tax=Hydractinia symbiolongicarpus TaxID=13093 RepID=UPI00254EADBC|nr:uncharacterized protein LOC130636831 [Hydractinia symbiolongicarpus]
MSHRYSRRNNFSQYTNFSRHSNFSRPLQHIHRRHIPVADELCHLSSTISRSSYKTSYQADFEGKDFSKVYPKRLSLPPGNLSLVVNAHCIASMKKADVICNTKTDKDNQTSVPPDASMVGLETCKKNTFEKQASMICKTRYGKNKSKDFPAIGIVPGENFKQIEDHWLPGLR